MAISLSSRGWRLAVVGVALSASLAGCVVAPPRPSLPPPIERPARQPAMYFYPELSQDEVKQDRDRYECYRWAVRQTNVDPGMTPVRELPPPRAAVRDGAEVVAGAAAGAIVGAAVSSPRHTGQGLVLGAIFGSLLGAAAHESRVQAAEQAHARRQAARQQPLDNFQRAMGACMTGRGYRVG
jgi:Glycine zipper 2TM domain